jgi:hypothetical protein
MCYDIRFFNLIGNGPELRSIAGHSARRLQDKHTPTHDDKPPRVIPPEHMIDFEFSSANLLTYWPKETSLTEVSPA